MVEAAATQGPRVTVVEFRADPTELAAIYADMADRLGKIVPGSRVIGSATTTPWTIISPNGARMMLVMGPSEQAAARPNGSHALTLVVREPSKLNQAQVHGLLNVMQRLPLTDLELRELRTQLPLTVAMPDTMPPNALGGIAPLMAIHHMTDFLVMIDAMVGLGVPTIAMTVIDKGYPYRFTHRVDEHLRRLGIAIYPWSETACGLVDHVHRARRSGRKSLLVDDGGYTLPVILRDLRDLVPEFCGLVEQTMSGIFKLEPFGESIPIPIFSVAESRLKGSIEGYGVADAAIRNVLRLLPHEKFEGQAALVLGFGRIGEQLAEILRNRRMRVAVFDPEIVRLVAAHERGFLTASNLTTLLADHRPFLVVGSSGRTSFTGDDARSLRRDCYLVSTTSRDHEFALVDMASLATAIRDIGIIGTQYDLPQGVAATVLGHGFPINFHHAESLPNRYSDLVLAALLVGACTLAGNNHGFRPGHNVELTNRVLESAGLLERYYQLYGPGI